MSNKYPWSDQQKAIFEEVKSGQGNVVVDAKAGVGKTSTILESLEYIPDHKNWTIVAFNKKIAQELKEKVPNIFNGDIRTLHSLGLSAISRKFRSRVNNKKVNVILDEILGKAKGFKDVKFELRKTVSLCKGYLVDGDDMIDTIMDMHDIDPTNISRTRFIETVQKTLRECAKRVNQVDFDDMIWFPYVHKISIPKYDFSFIDEAQDLNNCQIHLALQTVKRNGRIFALGDTDQALYRFRGVSLDVMNQLMEKLNAKKLPLHICYRCPESVIKEAQKYVPEITVSPSAIKGVVSNVTEKEMVKKAKPGCFILSRVNAPLVKYALKFIREEVPASIQGRDVGQNLISVLKKYPNKDIDGFLDWLDNWEMNEVTRLQKKDRDYEHIEDKAACLRAIADSCSSMADLRKKIMDLFEDTDEKDRIILSTVHRAKGLERPVVYLLWNTFRGGNKSETNIKYVGITRSQKELYYVV